jgi:hypothetical protein
MIREILTYQPLFFAVALVFTFVRRCRMGLAARVAWTAAIFVCAVKFVFFEFVGGSAFSPELPEKLIWAWNWAYSGMCLLLLLSILLFFLPPRVKLFALPAIAWTASAVGVWNGLRLPETREVEIYFENLPESLDGYRILHLTDIHASSAARRWRTEAIVERANAARADLIVVTGDLVDGKPEFQAENVEPLRNLSAPDGVLHCTGNHEYYHGWSRWKAKYDEWGLRFLDGEWVSPRPGLVVAGARDAACTKAGLPVPDVSSAFDGATNGEFRVFLQHRPWLDCLKYGKVPLEDFDLQISGHTHGGVAPVIGWLTKVMNNGLLKGEYDLGRGRRLFVSSGVGQWAGFPIRFFDDSEINVLVLRR